MSAARLQLRGHRLTEPRTGLNVAAGPDFMSHPDRHCTTGNLANLGGDPDLFFSPITIDKNLAKTICNGRPGTPACPVKTDCLIYALDQRENTGVWGGYDLATQRQAALRIHTPKPRKPPARAQHVTRETAKETLEQRVRDLWEQELSDSAIALNLGLHSGAVGRIRKRLGLATLYGANGRRLPQAVNA